MRGDIQQLSKSTKYTPSSETGQRCPTPAYSLQTVVSLCVAFIKVIPEENITYTCIYSNIITHKQVNTQRLQMTRFTLAAS